MPIYTSYMIHASYKIPINRIATCYSFEQSAGQDSYEFHDFFFLLSSFSPLSSFSRNGGLMLAFSLKFFRLRENQDASLVLSHENGRFLERRNGCKASNDLGCKVTGSNLDTGKDFSP